MCAASAVTCAFAKRSEALACREVFVASDWIRPNRTRWRAVAGSFRRAGERLDVHDLGAEVLQRGRRIEVAVAGLVRYPDPGAAML
jgi:hypothetical protein